MPRTPKPRRPSDVDIGRLVGLYEDALERHGATPAALQWPRGRQDERFRSVCRYLTEQPGRTLLDFGCGLGDLKAFLDYSHYELSYRGVDLVESFVVKAQERFGIDAARKIEHIDDLVGRYDYVVAIGAFNNKYDPDEKKNEEIVFELIRELFNRCETMCAVNMMTDQVDFRQKSAYHQNVGRLYEFVCSQLSRRIVIDHSYLPYEFTLVVWKDDEDSSAGD